MSEDCHSSDNAQPEAALGGDVACHECGQPVKPAEAYLCELERADGSTETVVFHSGIDRMCPVRYAAKRLGQINDRLEAILAALAGGKIDLRGSRK